MSKLICFLGPDRTNKTTMCQRYADAGWTHIHFSSSDYSELLTTSSDWVVADRGWIEKSFYDWTRRGIITPPEVVCEEVRQFEQQLAKRYGSVELILMYSPWDDLMIQRHLDEIYQLGHQGAELDQRKNEHVLYYSWIQRVWQYSMFTREIRPVLRGGYNV